MRFAQVIVLATIVGLSAARPVSAHQTPQAQPGGDYYAELTEIILLLQKSADLDPRDPVVYFYMLQTYNLQYLYCLQRQTALVVQGRGESPEAKQLQLEIGRLDVMMRITVRRLRALGYRVDWPTDLDGPMDTPLPRPQTPHRPSRAQIDSKQGLPSALLGSIVAHSPLPSAPN